MPIGCNQIACELIITFHYFKHVRLFEIRIDSRNLASTSDTYKSQNWIEENYSVLSSSEENNCSEGGGLEPLSAKHVPTNSPQRHKDL